MAAWYVYSAAAGTATGADWTNAKTTLAAAITAAAAGDTYYIANDHAETQASALTLSVKGTPAAPDTFLCVNRAGSVPPVAADLTTGGKLTTTSNSAILVQSGTAYFYGITFSCGTGASTASITVSASGGNKLTMESCTFALATSATGSRVILGGGAGYQRLVNPIFTFGSTGQSLRADVGGTVICSRPGSSILSGGSTPTALFASSTGPLVLDGLDLSAFTSGKTILPTANLPMTLINCKIDSAVTVASTPIMNAANVDLIGCNSTTNVARNERYQYQGTLTTETTIIRTAGASDGTTAYSWKIVTNANAKRIFPFETFEGVVWNDTTGSAKTLTVHCVTDNVTLTDAEIWVEVEYLGSSATPVATLITDANATVLTTAANQTSDSGEAWTTTGLGTPVKQALAVTFTPQMKGPIRWRVKAAKASTTVYVCPKADVA